MTQLSVILPCYRAAQTAARSATALNDTLATHFASWEIILVDDGARDLPDSLCSESDNVRLIRLPTNRGKGAAVRAGMLAATGDVRLYTDVDLPYGAAAFPAMTRYITERGFHAVVGDRTMPGSVYGARLNWARRSSSYAFSFVVGRIVTGGFFDTQCGLKAFRGDVAQLLFSALRVDRFAFDVELLYICLKHRLDIKRIPVQLENNVNSSVRLARDGLQGIVDIFRIKYHQMSGVYRLLELERIVEADHAKVLSASGGTHCT